MSHKPELILGDNPFFGVNHMVGSQVRSSTLNLYDEASEVIAVASESGFETFMITAGEEADVLLRVVAQNNERQHRLALALVLPNPHFINTQIAERGFFGAALATANFDKSLFTDSILLIRHGLSGFRKLALLRYLRAEIKRHSDMGFFVSHLCLHNIVVDMMLGLGREEFLADFVYCCRRLQKQPVLISQNAEKVLSAGLLTDFTLCFSYNVAGYMVNPSLSKIRLLLESEVPHNSKIRLWAMQVLASGAVDLTDALDDSSLEFFDGIVYATKKPGRVADFALACDCRSASS